MDGCSSVPFKNGGSAVACTHRILFDGGCRAEFATLPGCEEKTAICLVAQQRLEHRPAKRDEVASSGAAGNLG
jgi:hypothetical protein